MNIADFGPGYEDLTDAANAFIQRYRDMGYREYEGRTRAVFVRPNGRFVVKIPLDNEGFYAISKESRWSHPEIKVAKNRILEHPESGLIIQISEFVDPIDSDYPSWAYAVDGQQVGRNKSGVIVAFDL